MGQKGIHGVSSIDACVRRRAAYGHVSFLAGKWTVSRRVYLPVLTPKIGMVGQKIGALDCSHPLRTSIRHGQHDDLHGPYELPDGFIWGIQRVRNGCGRVYPVYRRRSASSCSKIYVQSAGYRLGNQPAGVSVSPYGWDSVCLLQVWRKIESTESVMLRAATAQGCGRERRQQLASKIS